MFDYEVHGDPYEDKLYDEVYVANIVAEASMMIDVVIRALRTD